MQKIQNTIFDILDDPALTNDLFELPNDALTLIFSSTETCLGELKLFTALKSKIDKLENQEQVKFLKEIASKYIRIS